MTGSASTESRSTIDGVSPDEPTVSVILPTYDRASVLPGAIGTVFEQTHQPLELVVVDGETSIFIGPFVPEEREDE